MGKIKDEDAVFWELMEHAGVKALSGKKDKHKITPFDTSKPEIDVVSTPQSLPAILRRKFQGNAPPRKNIKKQKRKPRNIEPDISIDLHGDTQKQALEKVRLLLKNSGRHNWRTILIITGKGLNSGEGGVLRNAVWHLLDHYQAKSGLKFSWAPPYLGGRGAVLVCLP